MKPIGPVRLRFRNAFFLLALSVFLIQACSTETGEESGPAPDPDPIMDGGQDDETDSPERVLVFSRTEGFRHGSIDEGIAAIEALAGENGFRVENTEATDQFTAEGLAGFDLVIFLNTTGDVLDRPEEEAFEAFIRAGGAYMGVHAATDTEYDWAWYGRLVGAYFNGHPNIQDAVMAVREPAHPSVGHLGAMWARTDEWYNFRDFQTGTITVLNLDESSYNGGTMGAEHPIAWYREFDGGRTFYTGMGHTASSYEEPDFRAHLLGGILWCLNR